MGWRPQDVYSCSVSEFWAAWNGWYKANSAPEKDPLTRTELDDILRTWDPNADGSGTRKAVA